MLFENRMTTVLSFYDQALTTVSIDEKSNIDHSKAVSSIAKNKAQVYRHMIEQHPEVYYTEDNEKWYDEQVRQLSFLLEMFCKCVNEALYHCSGQNAAWLVKMQELGSYVAENKLIKSILREEENDQRTPQMQSMYARINTANFEALRRLSWELAEN